MRNHLIRNRPDAWRRDFRQGLCRPRHPYHFNVVAYGNLLFFSSVGDHAAGTIEEHTKFAIDALEKNLIAAGSSLQKVLKVSVFLKNIEDYDKMNVIYKARNWGPVPPARTVIARDHNRCSKSTESPTSKGWIWLKI